MPAGEGVAAYAAHGGTMAVFLSAARPRELQDALLAVGSAYGPDTPAAIVERVSWPDERIVRTSVGGLADALVALGATLTVLVLVGDALAPGAPAGRSHLYAPDFTHTFRLRSPAGSTAGRPSQRTRP
jgi:precorrin-4/cobalt-precorrin-4 C11-methyltransferase